MLRFLSILLFVLVAGCGSTPPSKFYALPGTPSTLTADRGGLALRIGPFTFPDYLRRPNIVTRPSPNRIDVAEFDRWAGSLENDFHRVLGSQLGSALASGKVSTYPAELSFEADYVILGQVVTFDGAPSGEVTLEVQWTVIAAGNKEVMTAQRSIITQPVSGADYGALVDAHARAVAQLGTEMEAELRRLMPGS